MRCHYELQLIRWRRTKQFLNTIHFHTYICTHFIALNPTNLDVSHWWKLKDENEMKLSSLSCLSSNTTNFVLSKLDVQTNQMVVRRMQRTWNKLSYTIWMVNGGDMRKKIVDLMPIQMYEMIKYLKSFEMSMRRRQDRAECVMHSLLNGNDKMRFEKRIGM